MIPILEQLTPQDVNQNLKFPFYYDKNIIGSELIIYDYYTNNIMAYCSENENENENIEHEYALNTGKANELGLKNGEVYKVAVRVILEDGTISGLSDKVILRCYSTPTLDFTDFPDSITSDTHTFQLQYTQLENEPLSSYRIIVENESGLIYSQTDWMTDANLRATISNLVTNTKVSKTYKYTIYAEGYTLYNTLVKSEGYDLIVNFSVDDVNILMSAENEFYKGIVNISTNLNLIDGQYSGDESDILYEDNSAVNLTDGQTIGFSKDNWQLSQNWYTKLVGRNFVPNSVVMSFNNGKILVYYLRRILSSTIIDGQDYETISFMLVGKDDEGDEYTTESNQIITNDGVWTNDAKLMLTIGKINNEFKLQLNYVGGDGNVIS